MFHKILFIVNAFKRMVIVPRQDMKMVYQSRCFIQLAGDIEFSRWLLKSEATFSRIFILFYYRNASLLPLNGET